LFISLILGLLSTLNPILYFPLALSLGYTTHFQLQSIKAYNNQFKEKLNNTKKIEIKNENKEIENKKQNKEKKEVKRIINDYYNELMFYNNIEIKEKPKTLVKKKY